MTTIIVLAMHGMPPKDFPKNEKREFFRLARQVEDEKRTDVLPRFQELDQKMRQWPRTRDNDLFHATAYELAQAMQKKTGCEVLVGFNEFCAPNMTEILDLAASKKPERVIVITPMVTRGGSHSELEIPEDISAAQKRHPTVQFSYQWPYDTEAIAQFLTDQITSVKN